MYPTLVVIAGFRLTSFSIFAVLAWVVWSFVFWKSLREEGVSEEHIFDLMFYGTIVALVAARGAFVFTHWDQFSSALLKIVALWVAPGLSLIVAIVAGVASMLMMGKRRKIRMGAVLDAVGLAIPGALIVGMVGALLDGSQVGKPTNAPWAIQYVGVAHDRHPYQLYVVLVLAILLVISGVMFQRAKEKKWPLGSVGVGVFLLWSAMTFLVDFFAEHDVYGRGLGAEQWVLIFIFTGAVGAWYSYIGGKFVVQRLFRRVWDAGGRAVKRMRSR